MPEMKNEYIEVNTNTVDKLRSKAYDLCIKLQKKEKDKYIKTGLFILEKFLYGLLGREKGVYEKVFEEYIEEEFKQKGIDFNEDDLNPIEDKFLTKKFVKKEFEEFVKKILEQDNKKLPKFLGALKALYKYRNEIIIVDGKKYTLWDVSIDTLLVDMNKFGAKDRNKFVNKYKLNKLLEEISKKNY